MFYKIKTKRQQSNKTLYNNSFS